MTHSIPQAELHDLAPSQIPEWYAYQLNPDSAVYNISFNHFFLSQVDAGAFLQAWQVLLDRHDAFRIRMTYADGRPRQYLGERVVLSPQTLFIDRTTLAPEAVEAEQERLARTFALAPFDFDADNLFRLHLVRYPGDESQLIFTVHHIVWDETSTLNLIREFVTAYSAAATGRSATLPALPSTFLDYADRVNQALASGKFDHHKAYWLTQFSDLPDALELPTDRPRPSLQTYNGNTVKSWLPRALARDLNNFCVRHNSTLFMLLLAVLDLYFYRVSGQHDFVLGCPIAGRDAGDKQQLGCFAVPMPIRCRIAPGMRFSDLFGQVAETVLAAFEHYRYPCVSMIEQLSHQKDLSRPKLFSIMAGVQNNKSEFVSIPLGHGSLYAKEVYAAENHGARFDLAIGLDPVGSDVKFFCTYNTDLYDQHTVEGIMDSLSALFAAVVADPSRPLEHYPLMSPTEMQRVLAGFNRTEAPREADRTVVDLIDAQCRNHPQATALLGDEGELRYGELDAFAHAIAQSLRKQGVSEGDMVGVWLGASHSLVASQLAVMRTGAVYVPLHEEWPASRLADVAAQVGFKAILTTRQRVDDAATLGQAVLTIEDLPHAPIGGDGEQASRARADGLAYILFTSGTTGRPKGIPIAHRGLHGLVVSTQERYRLSADDRMLCWTAPTFDAAMLDILWPLAAGAQVVLWPSAKPKVPAAVIEAIDQQRITALQTVPLMLDALNEARSKRPVQHSPLRLIICGAAAMSRPVRDRAKAAFGCRLANHYGPTETTVDALWFDCDEPSEGDMMPIGRPLPNVQAFVLDRHDQPLPVGVPGQICIASPGLSPGYWQAPALTQAAFFDATLVPGQPPLRLYRTGDLGRFDREGRLHYLGRRDDQVKVRGNRVELGDIESTLAQHPAVAKAAVVWRADEGEGRLKAFVELRDDAVNLFQSRGRTYRQCTYSQRPALRKAMNLIHHDTWPRYFAGSPVLARHWEQLYSHFPTYQFCLLDETDDVACVANGIPLYWNGDPATVPSGWDEGVELAFRQHAEGVAPNTILGLAGIVASHCQGLGLANKIVEGFRALAKMHGLDHFLGPVRPVGMTDDGMDVHAWAKACDENGEPLDFWLRVHMRLGARALGVADRSQRVEGTPEQWHEWTGQPIEQSGQYRLPDTLQPVDIDLQAGTGHYYDPSIWVGHYGLRDAAFGIRAHYGVSDLREHLSARLPAYMLPDDWQIVSAIPLTENGKVDARRLVATAAEAPGDAVTPATQTQSHLVGIWQDLLKTDGIGIDHDFFNLGGQSLKVIEMLARVEQAFGRKVRLQEFYRQPTIRHLETLAVG